MIKNILSNKSGNSEALSKNNHNIWKAVRIVGGDVLRGFYKLFYLRFSVLDDQWKTV